MQFSHFISKLTLVFGLICLNCSLSVAGERVMSYGFEDWTGDAVTTPGYIFSASYPGTWKAHESQTEVVSGGRGCGGRTAHAGKYYWHMTWYDGGKVDPCLGTRPDLSRHMGLWRRQPAGPGKIGWQREPQRRRRLCRDHAPLSQTGPLLGARRANR